MKLTSKRLQELGVLAAVLMLIQIGLSKYVYPIFGKTTETLFAITPTTALSSPTIGNKILGFMSGIIPFDLGSITGYLAVWLTISVLLIAGNWVYDQRWAWKGKNIYWRIAAILIYGHAVLYAGLVLLNWSSIGSLGINMAIGVAINAGIVAFVVSLLAKRLKFVRI